ncbi:MAG: hypothetical protein ABEI96_08790 [Haloarculaceae archaeon]
MSEPSLLSSVRRPEYTGERRCWPCTIVNLGVLCLLVAVLWAATTAAVALPVGAVGVAVVWLRGYLVPYTPSFAPRLVGALPGGEALFHEGTAVPERADSLGDAADGPDGEALLETLVEAGVLDVVGEQVIPAADFETAWHDEMSRLADRPTVALADVVDAVADAGDVRVVAEDGQEWVALGGEGVGVVAETWLTRPVAIAEVGAVRALEAHVDDPTVRRTAASTLRTFLESCPDCGTTLQEGTEVDCCGGYNGDREVPAETLVCPHCGVRLFTFE